MSCKIYNKEANKNIMPMHDLPVGKLGVILEGAHVGKIVSRGSIASDSKSNFIILGEKSKHDDCMNGFYSDCIIGIRVLEEGELIEVKYT